PFFASLIMFLISIVIGLAKPEERTAQLFTVSWFSVALIFLALAIYPIHQFFGGWERNLYILIWIFSFREIGIANAYHFFYRFPPGIPESRFWASVRNIIYICAIPLTVLYTAIRIAILTHGESVLQFFSSHITSAWIVERSFDVLMVASLLAIIALIVRNHFQIKAIDIRRRFRWIAVGIVSGFVPSLIFFVAKF